MAFRPVATAVIAACALPVAGCSTEMDDSADIRAPAAVAVGPAVDCVDTSRIDTTEAHDDYTIDFRMIDNTVYRNTLTARCTGLGFEDRFSYETSIGRLCSIDTITVLYSDGGRGATCGLGDFVPVRYAEAG